MTNIGKSTMARVREYLEQRPGKQITAGELSATLGISTNSANTCFYQLVHKPGSGVRRVETGVYVYHQAQPAMAEIQATPDGGVRLAVPGAETPEDEITPAEETYSEPQIEEKPIGEILKLCGKPLPNGNIIILDDQQNLWRASRLLE